MILKFFQLCMMIVGCYFYFMFFVKIYNLGLWVGNYKGCIKSRVVNNKINIIDNKINIIDNKINIIDNYTLCDD